MSDTRRAVIGMTNYYDKETDRTWMRKEYEECIWKAGGIPVIFPITDDHEKIRELCNSVDGILLIGGEDIEPALYGEKKEEVCGELCEKRDAFELYMARYMVEIDKPLVGICRGHQVINVALGGTMIQDLPSAGRNELIHDQEPPYERTVHSITIQPDTVLASCIGKDQLDVNSWHHQAVDRLGNGLIAGAVATDGTIESVEYPGKRLVLGVQWHPEYLWGTPSDGFFKRLVKSAEEWAEENR